MEKPLTKSEKIGLLIIIASLLILLVGNIFHIILLTLLGLSIFWVLFIIALAGGI